MTRGRGRLSGGCCGLMVTRILGPECQSRRGASSGRRAGPSGQAAASAGPGGYPAERVMSDRARPHRLALLVEGIPDRALAVAFVRHELGRLGPEGGAEMIAAVAAGAEARDE